MLSPRCSRKYARLASVAPNRPSSARRELDLALGRRGPVAAQIWRRDVRHGVHGSASACSATSSSGCWRIWSVRPVRPPVRGVSADSGSDSRFLRTARCFIRLACPSQLRSMYEHILVPTDGSEGQQLQSSTRSTRRAHDVDVLTMTCSTRRRRSRDDLAGPEGATTGMIAEEHDESEPGMVGEDHDIERRYRSGHRPSSRQRRTRSTQSTPSPPRARHRTEQSSTTRTRTPSRSSSWRPTDGRASSGAAR